MVFTKKPTKAPAVMVETKKLSGKDSCCGHAPMFWRVKHLLTFILLVLNTVLLIRILCNQTKIPADQVGGRANYKMVQQIYRSDAFKSAQQQQIQQALQMYQTPTQGTTTVTPTTTDTVTAQ